MRSPGQAMNKILLIDNYDSFTYNLVQYFGVLGCDVVVRRNDEITVAEARAIAPNRICISPGPGRPEDAGVSNEIIRELGRDIPVLGVCLGHQCIGAVFGGEVVSAPRLMHGKTSPVRHNRSGVFEDLPNPFEATRYHSLIVRRETLPECLEITADTTENEIMGLRHREHPIYGVQFHPESVLTAEGMALLRNFLKL
jgi:anthranilate synthase/aminodeoxychorismate synthase-like glutamine amidotransferase